MGSCASRSQTRVFIALLAAIVSGPAILADTAIESLAGRRTTIELRLTAPRTLALIVASEADLPEAQRIVTLAESVQLPTLILVKLPEHGPTKAAVIRRAARRFFKSDFSRSHVFLAEEQALANPTAKAFIIETDSRISWTSKAYPSDAFVKASLAAANPQRPPSP